MFKKLTVASHDERSPHTLATTLSAPREAPQGFAELNVARLQNESSKVAPLGLKHARAMSFVQNTVSYEEEPSTVSFVGHQAVCKGFQTGLITKWDDQ